MKIKFLGKIIPYNNTKIKLKLSSKIGTIFINLYEDYILPNSEIEKKCIATRNLDPFINLSIIFLKQIIEKPT